MNVLFIVTDQHNAHALRCYGNDTIETPNLDRLAREGMRFETAICQSGQCRPSRYSIWTGQYTRTHGLYSNAIEENPNVESIGKLFKSAGYVTATIGKHHMKLSPLTHHGFDIEHLGRNSRFKKKGRFLPIDKVHPGDLPVGESDVPNDRHPAGIVANLTREFLRENRDNRFLLWCSFHGPHPPICPSRPWAVQYPPASLQLPPNHEYDNETPIPGMDKLRVSSGVFDEATHKAVLSYYYGYVSQIDYNIGLVLDELSRLGLMDETLIIFTSDHGEMMGEHGVWTKGKTGYDATIRVPLLMRFPQVLPANVRKSELVGSIDLLPTALDLCGIPVPGGVQGTSLRPLIEGRTPPWREFIVSEIGPSPYRNCITLHGARHKLVQGKQDGEIGFEQFFDLENDPWEMKNEIGNDAYGELIGAFRRELETWERTAPITPALQ